MVVLGGLDSIKDQPIEMIICSIEVPAQVLFALSAAGIAPLVPGKPRVRMGSITGYVTAKGLAVTAKLKLKPVGIRAAMGMCTIDLDSMSLAGQNARAGGAVDEIFRVFRFDRLVFE